MEIFENYKNYKKFEPEYQTWKDKKTLSETKKLEYLKQNPIDEETRQKDIQKGKALLHAIDVMDEYSQSKAENMEIATQSAIGVFAQIATFVGIGLGYAISIIPRIKSGLKNLAAKYPKAKSVIPLLPVGIGMITSMISTMWLQGWAASKEVGASRRGRFEAIKKELSDPKDFAVLNDEQLSEQIKIANNIPTTNDMKKGVVAQNSNMINPLNAISTVKDMLHSDIKEAQERREFDKKLYKNADNNIRLSQTDIENAKKDQQLLHAITEKIDTQSQDYAQNVEFATVAVQTIALAGGGLTGYIANKLVKLLKVKNAIIASFTPPVIGAAVALGFMFWAAGVQKQASRVGRYLAKKEIEQDLNNFVYVDKEKSDNIPDNIKIKKEEKPGFVKFIIQAFKNNSEYKKYIETKNVENIKKRKALKNIKLTEKQLKDAKRLQKNTFKVFNKLDEKSQGYAESVEAVGEVLATPVTTISSLLGAGLGWLLSRKMWKSGKVPEIKALIPIYIGALIGIIPGLMMKYHFNKEQKKASRVAHMLALNEMKDYKNYVDYENLTPDDTTSPVSKQNKKIQSEQQNLIMKNFNKE